MAERALISYIHSRDGLIEALVMSVTRSLKYHVWAAPSNPDSPSTVQLKYMGTILPTDPTDYNEIEELVRAIYERNANT